MRGINPLIRDFAVAITALVFIVSLVACVSMFLP